jgi:hypothetical protein
MLCILRINNKGDNMGDLKGKLNKLIDIYGLNHEKVIEYSQYVDPFVVAEQVENLRKIEKFKEFKLERCL